MPETHLKLMIPGPIEVEDEVLDMLGAPVRPHYGDAWVAIHNETLDLLRQVFKTSGKMFILPGSGNLGNDAAIQSLFAPGDHVAVGVNGNFGIRLNEILKANGMIPVPVEVDPSRPLDAAGFERALAADPQIVGIAAVHLETSTSILNPVREIAAVARKHNVMCLIDAVASLAGTDLRMDEWGIDVCTSASQKGLGGVPGLAIVAVGPRGWERIANQAERPRSWYLDLRRWQWYAENWGDWHPFPVTMPTSVVLALRAALQSLIKEGLEARFKHYEVLAARLRSGLKSVGFTLFADESLMAPVLTAVNCPPGATSEQIMRYLETEHKIKITTGFGPYKNTVIRIGHMGNAINEADIDGLLAGLAEWSKVLQR